MDHVEDVDLVLKQIIRVCKPGGHFNLMVEVNHQPTSCEPHYITPKYIVEYLASNFTIHNVKVYKPVDTGGLWDAIEQNQCYDDPINTNREGWFFASFTKKV